MNKPGLPKGNTRYKQGYYTCNNIEKYLGNPGNIRYLSGLELLCFRYLDNNKNVLKWGSEIIQIPYFDKSTNKKRIYFVDIYAEFINNNNNITKAIIEIKPLKQTQPPNVRGKGYQKRLCDYIKNISKWEYAKAYAKSNGMDFFILTEKQLQ
jgi:hypothetical protein